MNPTLKVWLQVFALVAAEAGLVIGIATQVQRFAQSALWRRTVWQVCILSLLLLTVFEFTGTARGFLAWKGNRSERRSESPAANVTRKALDTAGVALPAVQSNFRPMILTQAAPRRQSEQASRAGEQLPAAREPMTPAVGTAGPAIQASRAASRAEETSPISDSIAVLGLGILWMTGAATILGRVLFSRVALEILRWRRGDVRERGLEELTRRLALQLGIRRRVRLLESARFSGPVTFGMLRPTVGLPTDFRARYTPVQQEAMLAHELAHLAGGDPAWYLAADVLASVLWWHPLVWWARRRLHSECEMAADEASLVVADGPGALAECLVELGRRLTRREAPGRMGVAGSGFRSALGRRVDRLISLEGCDWSPPNRWQSGAVKMIGPLVLVAVTILASAWTVPQALTKGENMQTMRQTWKQSLAAFALLATLGSDGKPVAAKQDSPQIPAEPQAPVRSMPPGPISPAASPAPPELPLAPAMRGLLGRNRGGRGTGQFPSQQQAAIYSKLENIRLEAVKYPGVPLGEIVRELVQESKKLDLDKEGINFVLDRQPPPEPATPIDANGLPVAIESPDLSSVSIMIDPPLHNVRLIDLLEAMTRTADRPIQYQIRDFGVILSLAPNRNSAARSEMTMTAPLEARTFFVGDNDSFIAGLESAFGIKAFTDPAEAPKENGSNPRFAQATQEALRKLLVKLGVEMDLPNKAVFFNYRTGVIMLRASREDEEVFSAAMVTLGGTDMSKPKNR